MTKTKLTPEAINKIIHKFLGHCVHEFIDNGKGTAQARFQCQRCGQRAWIEQQIIPDYYNSLDLLRPAELKLSQSDKRTYAQCVIIEHVLFDSDIRDGENEGDETIQNLELFLIMTVPASIRATAIAEVIRGIDDVR